jgi:hypothetical protein
MLFYNVDATKSMFMKITSKLIPMHVLIILVLNAYTVPLLGSRLDRAVVQRRDNDWLWDESTSVLSEQFCIPCANGSIYDADVWSVGSSYFV